MRELRQPLQRIYLQIHPGATTGLDLCRFLKTSRTSRSHCEIKRRLGCSDRIIREHVPEAPNEDCVRIKIDRTQRAWPHTYRPA